MLWDCKREALRRLGVNTGEGVKTRHWPTTTNINFQISIMERQRFLRFRPLTVIMSRDYTVTTSSVLPKVI